MAAGSLEQLSVGAAAAVPSGLLRLVAPALVEPPPPQPDDDQAAAIAVRQGSGPLVVVGGPGTGKTTVAVQTVLTRIDRDGLDPAQVLVLAPTRSAATALRERVTARLGRTLREPLARTPHSYAFGLLRRWLVLDGEPAPRLISGAEQDRVLADLLAGHAAGAGFVPRWPTDLDQQVRTLRGFRDELRDLLMRAVERGLSPADLARLGRDHDRPDWVAASDVYAEYLDVTSLATPGAFDPAGIVEAAAALLAGDAQLLAAERASRALVIVDDAQELTTSGARLVAMLAGGGHDLVLLGDPDVATQGFRGARPRLLTEAADRLRTVDGGPARQVVLRTVHRHGLVLRRVAERVTAGISSSGLVAHRSARTTSRSPQRPGHREVHLLASPAQEAAFVAQLLRRAHLDDAVPWAEMAVVVRSVASTAALRRALAAAGVPVAVPGTELPVRDEPAVVPLRRVLRCVLEAGELTSDVVVGLLTGPIGGADTLAVRRIRQQLRGEELAAGGGRPSDELLVELVVEAVADAQAPAAAATAQGRPGPVRRVAEAIAAGRLALAEPGASAETVLWAIWQASGLAPQWQGLALAGGVAGARADRDLDAVVALFEAAAAFVDRLPHAHPAAFLDYLEGQDLPADTLAERAPAGDSVTLVTATGAAGREWDVVAVPGVQQGTWPDLRLRSSLLGAQELADLVDRHLPVRPPERGPVLDARRRAVLDDELRLFLVATTRARRHLVVTAVRSEDHLPSPFLDLVEAPGSDGGADAPGPGELRALTPVPRPMTLPALVAELRAVLLQEVAADEAGGTAGDQARRDRAALALARLARAGVPGADPDQWYGLAPLSDDGPLRPPGAPVRVSPSKVEQFDRCPLRWLLQTCGGARPTGASASLGTMIHELVEAVPDGDLGLLEELLALRFDGLGLREGWVKRDERARAEAMLTAFAEYVRAARSQGRELVATEHELVARVGRAEIHARLDRLERDADGRLVVVDLKTGKTKPTVAELARNAQLGTYQVAVHAAVEQVCAPEPDPDPVLRGAAPGGAALVQLGDGNKRVTVQQQAPLAEDAEPRWAGELVERVAEGMAGQEFAATVNPRCRTCDVRRSCPAQLEGRQVLR